MAVPYRKSEPVRNLGRGTDFWSEIQWSGTWYGFSVRIFFSTVRGTDFGPDSNLVRYVVRILVRKNPYRYGFFFRYGTGYGPKFRIIEKIKGPFQISLKMKNIRTDRTDETLDRTGPKIIKCWFGPDFIKMLETKIDGKKKCFVVFLNSFDFKLLYSLAVVTF